MQITITAVEVDNTIDFYNEIATILNEQLGLTLELMPTVIPSIEHYGKALTVLVEYGGSVTLKLKSEFIKDYLEYSMTCFKRGLKFSKVLTKFMNKSREFDSEFKARWEL